MLNQDRYWAPPHAIKTGAQLQILLDQGRRQILLDQDRQDRRDQDCRQVPRPSRDHHHA